MGIDVYMEWPKQTSKEKDLQCTGFSIKAGKYGYLREAYHGGPYVTHYLLQEAFEADEAEAAIPAKVLRERLPKAVLLALYRDAIVYGEDPNAGVMEIGEKGDFLTTILGTLKEAARSKREVLDVASHINEEQIGEAKRRIETRELPDYALSFVDFVELAERKEAETGKPCTIVASY